MPEINNTLTNYLKTFSAWAKDSLGDKLDGNTALPANLLQSHDTPRGSTPSVFKLQISQAGIASLTKVPLANPATPDPPGTGIPLVNEAPADGQSYARQSSGWTTVISASGGTMTGNLTAPNITATGALSGASASISGLLTAGSATISGALSAAGLTLTAAFNGVTATFTGLLTAASLSLGGAMTFTSLPVNALNDAAAATAGVPVGGVYRNGSILMVRTV
jgi:hypothetical protein